MRRRFLATAVALGVMLTACGGSSDSSGDGATDGTGQAGTASSSTASDTAGTASDTEGTSAMTEATSATDAGSATASSAESGTAMEGGAAHGELVFAASVGPRTWDPHPETRAFAYGWYNLVYDGLLTTDASGEIAPGLASEWKLTNEAMELTLRDGVTFHDGTAFDAEAAKWNIEKGQATKGLTGQALATINEIEVVDPTHLVLHLSQSTPDLPNQLASFPGLIVSPQVAQGDLETGAAAGTGPYMIDSAASNPEAEWVFTANPDFWDSTVDQFEKVSGRIIADDAARANALSSGEVDLAYVAAGQLDQVSSSGAEMATAPTVISVFQVMDVNGTLVPEFADPNVRLALAHAIDPAAVVQVVQSGTGEPVTQLFAEGTVGYVDGYEAVTYDPELAKQMLADAGVTNLEFTVPAFGPFAVGAQVLQGLFADVGVTMNIDTVAPGEMTPKIVAGEYPAVFTYIPDRHPQSVYNKQLRPGSVYNPFTEGLPAVETAAAEIAGGADEAAQASAYSDMFTAVYGDGWIMPISQNVNSIAVSNSDLSNVEAWTGVATFAYLRGVQHS